jgi:hypothetical protein
MPEPPIIPSTAFVMVVALFRSNYLTAMPLPSIISNGKSKYRNINSFYACSR